MCKQYQRAVSWPSQQKMNAKTFTAHSEIYPLYFKQSEDLQNISSDQVLDHGLKMPGHWLKRNCIHMFSEIYIKTG